MDLKGPRQRVGPALLTTALVGLVRLYQATLRPVMGGQCRFVPTCSEYAIEALGVHGPFYGSWLALRRLLRCQPWGGAGFDPVPERRS